MMNYKNAMVLVATMVVVGAQAESISHGGTTINMDFVDISGANSADTSGYGAVDYNYRIGKYEVMASQWAAVIAADSNVGNAGSWSGTQPTASSSWYEAARFCNWLTTGDAYTGVYQFDGGGALTGYDRTYRNGNGVAYVLPSEDEWYKAAYYTGSDYSLYANGTDTAPGLETDANYGGTGGTYAGPWDVGTGLEEQNKNHRRVNVIRERVLAVLDLDRLNEKGLEAMTSTEVLGKIGIDNPTNPQHKDCCGVLREYLGEPKRIRGQNKWYVPLWKATSGPSYRTNVDDY